MLHIENYTNYTDHQKKRFCMKSMDLTGKYRVNENNDMIPHGRYSHFFRGTSSET